MKIIIPKSITGIIIMLAGAAVTSVPVLAPAGPYLMKLGVGVAGVGLAAKGMRAVKEKTVDSNVIFKHEKKFLDRIKSKGKKDAY